MPKVPAFQLPVAVPAVWIEKVPKTPHDPAYATVHSVLGDRLPLSKPDLGAHGALYILSADARAVEDLPRRVAKRALSAAGTS